MKRFLLTIILVTSIKLLVHAQDINLIKDYNKISSESELVSRLKGKKFFLDLWAPWCEPCKEEFKHSDTLFNELKKRDIVLLYVSLNFNVKEVDWKTDISTYNLKGFHVLANKELENSLTKLIWGHPGGYSIPRYLLISSTGKILLKDALSPDQGTKLYNQIDNVIK